MDFTAMHFSEWSPLFRLLLTFSCGGVTPAFSATSATLLVHAELWDIAGELPFRCSCFFCSCRLRVQRLLPAPAFRPPPAATTLSWLLPSQLFLPAGLILPLGPSLAPASSAVFRLSTGLFPNLDSPGSCLLLPDECHLWKGASAHA